jgi:hypothetical protein
VRKRRLCASRATGHQAAILFNYIPGYFETIPALKAMVTSIVVIFAMMFRFEHASQMADAYVPLTFAPGEAYQFDWSHEIVVMKGETVTREGRARPPVSTFDPNVTLSDTPSPIRRSAISAHFYVSAKTRRAISSNSSGVIIEAASGTGLTSGPLTSTALRFGATCCASSFIPYGARPGVPPPPHTAYKVAAAGGHALRTVHPFRQGLLILSSYTRRQCRKYGMATAAISDCHI